MTGLVGVQHAAPPAVHARLADLVMDTVAVTAFGARRAELSELRGVVLGPRRIEPCGGATVIGTQAVAPAEKAAMLNGSAAAADQLQDGHRLARGHPASHVVLAALAIAEERDLTAVAMHESVLAGYDIGARLGRAMGGTPAGVHDIGTWGSVAVAATVAHLLTDGDLSTVDRAVELACGAVLLTDASTIFTGHSGGHAFLGTSVAHGMWLGQAAVAGLRAQPGTLDRFFVEHAAAHWDAGALTGEEWEVCHGYLKLHPACAHLHGALDAAAEVVVTSSLDPSAIEQVLIETYAAAAAFAAVADDELSARFSLPTTVAIMLLQGRLDARSLTDDLVHSREVRALAERVIVCHDPDLDAGYPSGRPTRVTVRLADGRVLSACCDRPRGDGDGETHGILFREKATQLLQEAFGDRAESVLAVLEDWPARHTPRELGDALRLAASRSGAQ